MRTALLTLVLLSTSLPTRAGENDITWPLPWKIGTTLVYDKTTITQKQSKGVSKVRNYSDTTTISIVQARQDGFLQRWTSHDIKTESSGVTPAEQAIEREGVQRLSAIPLDVELDGQGLFVRIGNLSSLQPVYRDVVRLGMELGIARSAAGITDDAQREQAIAQARAAGAATLERMTSEPVLNNLVAPQPLSYNYFAVGGMVPGQVYEIEDLGENPLGGDPYPMLGNVRVTVDAADPRFLNAEWKIALHPTKSAPLLWAAVEKLTGTPFPAELRQGLPRQIDVHTELDVRIERATGIVQRMRRVETRKIMDSLETKTTTMNLRR